MTLGKLIDALASIPPDKEIDGFGDQHSYRGYYSDLAFELTGEKMPASKGLELAWACMGETFEGYKGGEYVMHRDTPIWIANYGRSGKKMMAINEDGTLELAEDE